MPIQMLVKKTDNIHVEVYVYEKDGQVEATNVKNEIPKSIEEVETVTFTFRQPNFSDSNTIMKQMNLTVGGAGSTGTSLGNLMDFRFEILRLLLVDWDLKDENGNKIPTTLKSVNSLQPAIAGAAVDGAMDDLKIS